MRQLETTQLDYLPTPGREIGLLDVMQIIATRKRVIAAIMGVCMAVSIIITLLTPKAWQADAQLALVAHDTKNVAAHDTSYEAPVVESIEDQLGLIQSPAMAERAIEWLKNDAVAKGDPTSSVQISPEELQKAITVSNPKDTNLLDVSVTAHGREQARLLANAVLNAFIELKTEMARHDVQNTADTLAQRVSIAEESAKAANRRLAAFKSSHKIVDLHFQESGALGEAQQQDAQIQVLRQDVLSNEARFNELSQRLKQENKNLQKAGGVRDDNLILALQTQLNTLEQTRAEAALRYRAKYPGMLPVYDRQIADLRKRIARAIQNAADGQTPSLASQGATLDSYKQAQENLVFSRAKLNAALASLNQMNHHTTALSNLENQYDALLSDAQLTSKLYSDLQSSLNSAEMAKDKINGNVQIAEVPLVSETPSRPRPVVNLVIGAFLGLSLSFITVLMREQLDQRVRTLQDIGRLTRAPIIATVPDLDHGDFARLTQESGALILADLYRMAYANLVMTTEMSGRFIRGGMVLLVTSAVPGEGKSTTAANLARTVARTGKRVVLVDADMRRATQSRLFDALGTRGLADVLEERLGLEQAITRSGTPNLYILHGGRAQGDAADLIVKPKMAQVLQSLRSAADVIIIDSPACSVVADALFLAPHADCILQVIGVGCVDNDDLEESVRALNASAKPRVCLVTHAPVDRKKNYYRGYYANSVPELPISGEPVLSLNGGGNGQNPEN